MDRPVLHAFVRELLALERLQAFAAALPARARVSEPVLPLLLATLHEQLDRGLVCLLPEDADARDAAEAAGWFIGAERVALLPSRGVRWGSGLEPPPHLVGERARALDVLAAGRARLRLGDRARGGDCRRVSERPAPVRLEVGAEPGLDGLAEALALAGYERVDRAEERGQFAVRGGLVDVFPTTGREPLRVEFFGDEIEQVRAFSPFTQRALHPVDDAVVYPAAERQADLTSRRWRTTRSRAAPVDPERPRARARPRAGLRLAAGRGAARLGRGGARPRSRSRARPSSIRSRSRSPSPSRRSGRRSPRAGSPRPRTELNGFVRGGNRVVVAFPHAGEALRHREPAPARRRARRSTPGQDLPEQPELLFAVAPARRGFVWRELGLVLLPDTQVFRKRPPRADRRLGRALASFADLRSGDFVVHEDHGVGKLLGFETKEVAGVTRDYLFLAFRGEDRLYVPHEQLGKVSKYIGADASSPALSKLGGKAWQNLKARARESRARARDRADRALRAAAAGAGHAVRPRARVAGAARGGVPVPRDRGPGACDRGGQGGSRGAAADGPARLRRRRLRQDRGRRPRRVRGRRQRQADARPLPDDDPRRAALEHVQGALPRLPRPRRDGLALPQAGRDEADPEGLRGGEGRRARRHAPRPQPRRDPEGSRARDPRRGAAVRRRAEGAASLAPARGGRARALRDADPAHAAHVALRAAGHLDHRDAARGPAPDPDDGRRVRRGAGQDGARARGRARRAGVLPAQPRRDDRGGGREAAAAVPEAPLHRRAREDAGARAGGEDARVPARRRATCSSRRRSSSRGSTSRRRTR